MSGLATQMAVNTIMATKRLEIVNGFGGDASNPACIQMIAGVQKEYTLIVGAILSAINANNTVTITPMPVPGEATLSTPLGGGPVAGTISPLPKMNALRVN